MAFDADKLGSRLADLAGDASPRRYVVAFSGGLDSSVLLHAICELRVAGGPQVLAVHVQHNLHADALAWELQCRAATGSLGVDYASVSVDVACDSGSGIEAAAREARYRALRKFVGAGEWLLSAHHQNDQAETLLLNLLRGSGIDGMAGIGLTQAFGDGKLVRPLLDVSRRELFEYAEAQGISWIEDPSNTDNKFDRNFLRNEVMPRLSGRWSAATTRLARSSALAAEASELIAQLADKDLEDIGRPARIDIEKLRSLSDARQRNVLRRAVRRCGLPIPPESALRRILDELVPAREDAAPLIQWRGGEARRYRSVLYLQADLPETPSRSPVAISADRRSADLGPAGTLRISSETAVGISPDLLQRGLDIRFRAGGETIRPAGSTHTHKLKKLFQEKGVVPWMRDRIPLLYSGDELVAVADLWVAHEFAADNSPGVVWSPRPELF